MTREISQIDKEITAIRRQLRRLEKIDPLSAASWQAAWDKHPDLRVKEKALFYERSEAQIMAIYKVLKIQRKVVSVEPI